MPPAPDHDQLFAEAFQRAQRMLESGASKSDILSFLTSAAETAAGSGAVSSILFVDEKGLLRNAASPRLPEDYLNAIDGLKPNAYLGTCAAAAATGLVVMTPDFRADNKWAELRHLPLALGFVGAWSMPIKAQDGKVLGTFGTYFREQRHPTAAEVKGVQLLANVAALVLHGMA